ncbi:DUF4019 domain-containing protein [Shewanella waksmanii]|uniref:DUF4019 domain-containing protein n=1 Tax=Shewanella waksmanii TaxID=213783 RepID=UPI003734E883
MKNIVLVVLILIAPWAFADQSSSMQSATQWLNLVDNGKYDASWQHADTLFQSQLSMSKWNDALKGSRTPLGQVVERTIISRNAFQSLPGVPDGEYLILQFSTQFAHKQSAVETLTLSKDSGQWLPVGYFIN